MGDAIRVLLVDDDGGNHTAEQLEQVDPRLDVTAVTAPTQHRRDRLEAVDCVVSAYRLPGTDGLEFLETVRAERPGLPFVLYTARERAAVASEALSAGVTDYVQKTDTAETFELLATRIESAVERRRATRRANRQERIADLVRTVQASLVRATTREDVDTAVCEALAEADPYVFAWIGDRDPADDCVRPRAAAGIDDAALDRIEIPVGEDRTGRGPTGAALRTQSVQAVQEIPEAPETEPWPGAARDCGYRSSVAIPLVYEDTCYGVVTVYAERAHAFDGGERSLLAELGDTVAHASHRIAVRQRSDMQYRDLFEEAPVMFALTRPENGEPVIEDCNRQFAETLGYDPGELIGRSLDALYTEDSAQDLLDRGGYQRALDGEFVREERAFRTRDGDRVETLSRAAPRRDATGEVVGTNVLYVDVTARRRAEAVLQQVQAMESAIDGMAILDETGTYVYANQALAEVYGYEESSALVGTEWETCYDEETVERFETTIFPTLEANGEWRGEVHGRRADGTQFPQELSMTRLDDGSLICVVRDVTARTQRERELEEVRDFLDQVFESMPYGVYVLDVEDYTVAYANDQATAQEGRTCYELTHRRDEPCDEGPGPTWACPLSEVETTGEPTSVEHVHYDDEGTERVYKLHSSPIFDDDGTVVQMVESAIEITERVEYEQQLREQRDNLEVLNEMVRHDIRNHLQTVLAWTEILDSRGHVDDDGKEHVTTVLNSARNAVDLTRTARDLAEVMLQDDTEQEVVNLARIINDEIDRVQSATENAVLSPEETIPDTNVLANEMLDSVFRNLLKNAVEHNDKPVPQVTVSVTEAGESVQVRVRDNGPGVPDPQKDEIFGKGEKGLESEGTGIGLYLVSTLVDGYGGDVWVEDNDPDGAVFVVELQNAE